MVKPEIWTNEQFANCSTQSRLLFIGMLNFADDSGVQKASYARLKMEIFPNDAFDKSIIKTMVDELILNELVIEYTIESKTYWRITGFMDHQKVQRPYYLYPWENGVTPTQSVLGQDSYTGITPIKNKTVLGQDSYTGITSIFRVSPKNGLLPPIFAKRAVFGVLQKCMIKNKMEFPDKIPSININRSLDLDLEIVDQEKDQEKNRRRQAPPSKKEREVQEKDLKIAAAEFFNKNPLDPETQKLLNRYVQINAKKNPGGFRRRVLEQLYLNPDQEKENWLASIDFYEKEERLRLKKEADFKKTQEKLISDKEKNKQERVRQEQIAPLISIFNNLDHQDKVRVKDKAIMAFESSTGQKLPNRSIPDLVLSVQISDIIRREYVQKIV